MTGVDIFGSGQNLLNALPQRRNAFASLLAKPVSTTHLFYVELWNAYQSLLLRPVIVASASQFNLRLVWPALGRRHL